MTSASAAPVTSAPGSNSRASCSSSPRSQADLTVAPAFGRIARPSSRRMTAIKPVSDRPCCRGDLEAAAHEQLTELRGLRDELARQTTLLERSQYTKRMQVRPRSLDCDERDIRARRTLRPGLIRATSSPRSENWPKPGHPPSQGTSEQ